MNIKRTARLHQCVLNFDCLVRCDPDLVTEIACVSSTRNLNRHARDHGPGYAKVFEVPDVGVLHQTLEQTTRSWSLQGERGNAFGNVFNLNVHARGVLSEPTKTRIGGRPAIRVFFETRNRAVVDYFATFVAPGCIDYLAHRHLSHVASDDAIDEARRIFAGQPVFEQRRDVEQRSSIADRVVLMLVMRLVRTDRVVTRPLAIAETFAERACSFVKGSTYRHLFLATDARG